MTCNGGVHWRFLGLWLHQCILISHLTSACRVCIDRMWSRQATHIQQYVHQRQQPPRPPQMHTCLHDTGCGAGRPRTTMMRRSAATASSRRSRWRTTRHLPSSTASAARLRVRGSCCLDVWMAQHCLTLVYCLSGALAGVWASWSPSVLCSVCSTLSCMA